KLSMRSSQDKHVLRKKLKTIQGLLSKIQTKHMLSLFMEMRHSQDKELFLRLLTIVVYVDSKQVVLYMLSQTTPSDLQLKAMTLDQQNTHQTRQKDLKYPLFM